MSFEDLIGGFDDGGQIESTFVGRHTYLQQLKQAWSRNRIFGVFGIRAVGKSRFVQEFLEHILKDTILDVTQNEVCNKITYYNVLNSNVLPDGNKASLTKDIRLINMDMVMHDTIDSLYIYICAVLDITPEYDTTNKTMWIEQILYNINKNTEVFVLVFDNAENVVDFAMRDQVLTLVQKIIKYSKNSNVFFTSTTKIMFSQIKSAYFTLELLPLTTTESKLLLHTAAPSVVLGGYEASILELSEGLPLLILMIGSELAEDDGITPQDMSEMLASFRLRALSREYYPEEDRIDHVYKKFIERLSKKSQHHMSILEFIPGSFNIEEARKILEQEHTKKVQGTQTISTRYNTDALAKHEAIVPLRRRHMVIHHTSTKRFVIQGILKECLKVFFTLKNIPEVRARYIKTFTKVMKDIAAKLGTIEYTKALSEFAVEQPNLQKLLTEVMYTREETYHYFIEVAEKCTTLIERFLMKESEKFYDGCLQLADEYGREVDKATVHIAVGSIATNVKGELKKGAEHYDSALKVLKQRGKSIQLATVYQRMGWNLHMQGHNAKAVGYFKESLDISLPSGKEYERLMIQSFNGLGVAHTLLGIFGDAEKYLMQALERSKRALGEDHPSVGGTYNNIGVLYKQKLDHEKALEYFEKGLEIKRNKQHPASSIAYSLSNIANAYSTGFGRHKKAHDLCEQAMGALKEPAIPPIHAIALIYDTHGKVFMSEGNFEQACQMFTKSIEMKETNIMEFISYFESKLHLAQAKKKEGKYAISIRITKDVLVDKDKAIKSMPQNTLIHECLECLADIYKETGNNAEYSETLDKIQSELFRLENFHLSQCNDKGVDMIKIQLLEVNDKIEQVNDV